MIDKLYNNFILNPDYKAECVADLMGSQAGQLVKCSNKFEFIDKLLFDDDFYQKWGDDCCEELTYEERYKLWFANNYETGMEYNLDIEPDFENDYYEPTPKRKLKKLESNWKSYSKTLPLSKEIYLDVFGEPKTHAEWADSFNKVGRINRLIIKHANGEIRE